MPVNPDLPTVLNENRRKPLTPGQITAAATARPTATSSIPSPAPATASAAAAASAPASAQSQAAAEYQRKLEVYQQAQTDMRHLQSEISKAKTAAERNRLNSHLVHMVKHQPAKPRKPPVLQAAEAHKAELAAIHVAHQASHEVRRLIHHEAPTIRKFVKKATRQSLVEEEAKKRLHAAHRGDYQPGNKMLAALEKDVHGKVSKRTRYFVHKGQRQLPAAKPHGQVIVDGKVNPSFKEAARQERKTVATTIAFVKREAGQAEHKAQVAAHQAFQKRRDKGIADVGGHGNLRNFEAIRELGDAHNEANILRAEGKKVTAAQERALAMDVHHKDRARRVRDRKLLRTFGAVPAQDRQFSRALQRARRGGGPQVRKKATRLLKARAQKRRKARASGADWANFESPLDTQLVEVKGKPAHTRVIASQTLHRIYSKQKAAEASAQAAQDARSPIAKIATHVKDEALGALDTLNPSHYGDYASIIWEGTRGAGQEVLYAADQVFNGGGGHISPARFPKIAAMAGEAWHSDPVLGFAQKLATGSSPGEALDELSRRASENPGALTLDLLPLAGTAVKGVQEARYGGEAVSRARSSAAAIGTPGADRALAGGLLTRIKAVGRQRAGARAAAAADARALRGYMKGIKDLRQSEEFLRSMGMVHEADLVSEVRLRQEARRGSVATEARRGGGRTPRSYSRLGPVRGAQKASEYVQGALGRDPSVVSQRTLKGSARAARRGQQASNLVNEIAMAKTVRGNEKALGGAFAGPRRKLALAAYSLRYEGSVRLPTAASDLAKIEETARALGSDAGDATAAVVSQLREDLAVHGDHSVIFDPKVSKAVSVAMKEHETAKGYLIKHGALTEAQGHFRPAVGAALRRGEVVFRHAGEDVSPGRVARVDGFYKTHETPEELAAANPVPVADVSEHATPVVRHQADVQAELKVARGGVVAADRELAALQSEANSRAAVRARAGEDQGLNGPVPLSHEDRLRAVEIRHAKAALKGRREHVAALEGELRSVGGSVRRSRGKVPADRAPRFVKSVVREGVRKLPGEEVVPKAFGRVRDELGAILADGSLTPAEAAARIERLHLRLEKGMDKVRSGGAAYRKAASDAASEAAVARDSLAAVDKSIADAKSSLASEERAVKATTGPDQTVHRERVADLQRRLARYGEIRSELTRQGVEGVKAEARARSFVAKADVQLAGGRQMTEHLRGVAARLRSFKERDHADGLVQPLRPAGDDGTVEWVVEDTPAGPVADPLVLKDKRLVDPVKGADLAAGGGYFDPKIKERGHEPSIAPGLAPSLRDAERIMQLDLSGPPTVAASIESRARFLGVQRMKQVLLALNPHGGVMSLADGQRLLDRLHAQGESYELVAARPGGDSVDPVTMEASDVHELFRAPHAGEQVHVVPGAIMDVWRDATKQPSRFALLGQVIQRQFVQAVLPLSTTWMAGNLLDLATRVALVGGNPFGSLRAQKALEAAMQELSPEWRGFMLDHLVGHYGSRATVIEPVRMRDVFDGTKLEAAGRALTGVGDLGRRATGNLGPRALQGAFDVASKMEEPFVRAAQGQVARAMARELGCWTADHVAMGRALAGAMFVDRHLAEEFGRRTLEIVGDYNRSFRGAAIMNFIDPFWTWVREANKLVFVTLPIGHPVRTALLMNIAVLPDHIRAKLKDDRLLIDQMAKEGIPRNLAAQILGGELNYDASRRAELRSLFPHPKEGFLWGALPAGGGFFVPQVPFTSFGEASKLMHDPISYFVSRPFPYVQRGLAGALGYSPTFDTAGQIAAKHFLGGALGYGPNDPRSKASGTPGWELALTGSLTAFVPGSTQFYEARVGGTPDTASSILHPKAIAGSEVPWWQNRAFNAFGPVKNLTVGPKAAKPYPVGAVEHVQSVIDRIAHKAERLNRDLPPIYTASGRKLVYQAGAYVPARQQPKEKGAPPASRQIKRAGRGTDVPQPGRKAAREAVSKIVGKFPELGPNGAAQAIAGASRKYDVPPEVLAAIYKVESASGTNTSDSTAGAQGPMQFMPATFATYGVLAPGRRGTPDIQNTADAIYSAANYLHASGASTNLHDAVYSYNHAEWYVQEVMDYAQGYSAPEWRRAGTGATFTDSGVRDSGLPRKVVTKWLKPADSTAVVTRFVPEFEAALVKLAKGSGQPLMINEGWRSYARQEELYQAYLNGTGALAANPASGTAPHMLGIAADIQLTPEQRALLPKYGLGLPVPGESWHVQLINTPPLSSTPPGGSPSLPSAGVTSSGAVGASVAPAGGPSPVGVSGGGSRVLGDDRLALLAMRMLSGKISMVRYLELASRG